MSAVTLTLRTPPELVLDAGCVRPDAFAFLAEADIARLRVWHGHDALRLGDLFDVRGGRSGEVRVSGDTFRVNRLGARMAGGSLVIEGGAGAHVGGEMTGGTLCVEGDAGDWAGAAMTGGLLELRGRAGAHLGGACPGSARGMTGGTLVVRGGAGDFAGERMRRGLIAVEGDLGDCAGAGMIAGTIVAFGAAGRRAGLGLKRGTLVVHGSVRLLPTFRYACTYVPPVLALYLRALREQYGVERAADGAGTGVYHRYTGDYAELGKGEVLVWADSPS